MAIHWGIDGWPNGWADKSWGLLILPCFNLGLAALSAVLPRFDSRLRSYNPETRASVGRVLGIIGLATTCFLSAMALLIDAMALGWKFDVLFVVNLGVLLLFVVLGNYLPKLRPNRFAGIRTPWTLKSPEVWIRTHRLFGRIMLLGSLALIPFCLFLPDIWYMPLFITCVILLTFGSMIYSYRCYRSLPSG